MRFFRFNGIDLFYMLNYMMLRRIRRMKSRDQPRLTEPLPVPPPHLPHATDASYLNSAGKNGNDVIHSRMRRKKSQILRAKSLWYINFNGKQRNADEMPKTAIYNAETKAIRAIGTNKFISIFKNTARQNVNSSRIFLQIHERWWLRRRTTNRSTAIQN